MTTKTDTAIVCRTRRQIDALVAEHITKPFPAPVLACNPGIIPEYTTWARMEQVIRNREEAGYHWLLKTAFYPGDACWAGLTPHDCSGFNGVPDVYESGPTLPIAASIAALASAGINVTYSPIEESTP
jgi:hypothetical protein